MNFSNWGYFGKIRVVYLLLKCNLLILIKIRIKSSLFLYFFSIFFRIKVFSVKL